MIEKLNTTKSVSLLLVILFVLMFCISFFSEGTFDPGDGVRHYLISRYSWQHHYLFLDSWGKPFFTLISSPFSQFGLIGINVFNILCGLFSSWFCFRIAKKLNFRYAFLVIPILFFSSSYFPTLNSGLTEPFFSLVLITAIYLMFEKRYLFAGIIVSFLPFVRSEGYLILPLFVGIFIYHKKYLHILFLSFATIVYSTIGYFYYKDFFWIINQNPYTGSNRDIYGKGNLFHFLENYNFIWGYVLAITFVLGCIAMVIYIIKHKIKKISSCNNHFLVEELTLIYGSFFIYFLAHSVFWWQGIFNSLGMLRVIAGIMPCSALICLRGFHLIMFNPIVKRKAIEFSVIILFLTSIIYNTIKQDYFPFKLITEQELIKDVGEWFKTTDYKNQLIYFQYPSLAYHLEINPFDTKKSGSLWGLYPQINEWGIHTIPDSTIIIWDAHFGPNEARIPLDSIINDPHFELIKSFYPAERYTTLGSYPFCVYVFMKHNARLTPIVFENYFYDLEQFNKDVINTDSLTMEKSYSGKTSYKFTSNIEFGIMIEKNFVENRMAENTTQVEFRAKIFSHEKNMSDLLAVASISDTENKLIYWDGKKISMNDTAKWENINVFFNAGEALFKTGNKANFYIWNLGKNEFYVDDMELKYWGKSRK